MNWIYQSRNQVRCVCLRLWGCHFSQVPLVLQEFSVTLPVTARHRSGGVGGLFEYEYSQFGDNTVTCGAVFKCDFCLGASESLATSDGFCLGASES
jgi:hypothetical protein